MSGWSPGLGVLAASFSSTDSGPVFRRAGGQGCSQHTLVRSEEGSSPHPTPSNRKMTEEPSERDGMLDTSARDIGQSGTGRERGADSAGRPLLRADCGLGCAPLWSGEHSHVMWADGQGRRPELGLPPLAAEHPSTCTRTSPGRPAG